MAINTGTTYVNTFVSKKNAYAAPITTGQNRYNIGEYIRQNMSGSWLAAIWQTGPRKFYATFVPNNAGITDTTKGSPGGTNPDIVDFNLNGTIIEVETANDIVGNNLLNVISGIKSGSITVASMRIYPRAVINAMLENDTVGVGDDARANIVELSSDGHIITDNIVTDSINPAICHLVSRGLASAMSRIGTNIPSVSPSWKRIFNPQGIYPTS